MATLGTRPIDLGSPQQRAVLVALHFREGRAVSVSELIDDVWGNHPPRSAVGAIRTYVSRLRRVLDPEHVTRRRSTLLPAVADGYALREPVEAEDVGRLRRLTADAERDRRAGATQDALRQLRQATALWRGTSLAGVPGPLADLQRMRLEERRLSLTEACVELELELGERSTAIAELTAVCAEYPMRERPRELLMRALRESGRQAEALAVFADLRRLLNNEFGVEPGDALRELHLLLLRDTPEESPAPATPAQLPSDITDFTGRTRMVADLRSELVDRSGRGTRVAAVTGMAGAGKTTLAVHVAHTLLEEFPDGQLYADLSAPGAEPAGILERFLRALGVPGAAVPDAVGERSALFRTTLARRRVLLLLDNAGDSARLRWLLPGTSGCAVLITSRRRGIGLPVSTVVALTAFSPPEALTLLDTVVGGDRITAEPEAAARVVAACGHLPLAVRTVGARLAAHPDWSVADVAASLSDERRRIPQMRDGSTAVEASFEIGYHQLPESDKRVFRLVSRPDLGEFSVAEVAVLASCDERSAERAVETLVDVALLESPAPNRFHYHDLLRIFARGRSEATDSVADRIASTERLVTYYLATVRNAYVLTAPGTVPSSEARADTGPGGRPFGDAPAANRWLLTEKCNILAVVEQLSRCRQGQPRPLADLLLMLSRLSDHGVELHSLGTVAAKVVDLAVARDDPRSAGRARYVYARALHRSRQTSRAGRELTRANDEARSAGDRQLVALVAGLRGVVHEEQSAPEAAARCYLEAFRIARHIGDIRSVTTMFANMAGLRLAQGRLDEAVELCTYGRERARGVGDRVAMMIATHTRGHVHLAAHRGADAVADFVCCVDLARASGLSGWEAHSRALAERASTQV